MSRTIRKTIDGVKFFESQTRDKRLNYGCRCYYCVGASNDEQERKLKTLNKRELRKEILEYGATG